MIESGRNRLGWLSVGSVLLFLAGCGTPGVKERVEDAVSFREKIQEETAAYVATNRAPITLSRALELARMRTLKLTQQELQLTLSRLGREMAFSVFLPQVKATYGRNGTDKPIEMLMNGNPIRMSDQYLSDSSITLTQPIFTPQAWLLFAESSYVVKMGEFQLDRAREMLDVQVASLFYQAAVAERSMAMYRSQLKAAESLAEQIRAQAKRGYALDSDVARIEARVAMNRFDLSRARDTRSLTRAKLCEVLRFWPLESAIRLDGDSMTRIVDRPWQIRDESGKPVGIEADKARALSLEELLCQTLLCRKELWIGDQMIGFRKTAVLQALAGFLPQLYAGGSANWTTQSLQVQQRYWGGAYSAVLSIFDGFRTMESYRIARRQREAEFKTQEDRSAALLTGTFEAYQNWRQSAERRTVASKVLKACELDYQTANARFAKDQETASEVLDKLAALEQAKVQMISATYATALTEIVLRDAVGVGLMAPEEKKADEEGTRREPVDALLVD